MRPRSLLILFLVVAALGAFVWFFERDLPSTDERAEQAKKVLVFEPEEVTGLTIERGGEVVRFERPAAVAPEDEREDGQTAAEEGASADAASWRIAEPLEARADEDSIAGVLERLSDLEKERTLEEFVPEDAGLASPGTSVRVRTADDEWTLKVGEQIPASSNVLVTVEGRTEAYVVAGGFRDDLDKKPGEWRSKDAFPFDRSEISRLRLLGAGGEDEIVLEKSGDDFRVVAPYSDEADQDQVTDLLDELTGLTIEAFLDQPGPLTDLGLEPAEATVRATLGSGEDVEVRLGAARDEDAGKRFALTGGQVFETETDLAGLVLTAGDDWRSTDWTGLEVYEIDSFTLRQDGVGLTLERSDGDWLRGEDKIAYTTASDVLYAVADTEAERIVDAGSVTLGEPMMEIELGAKEGAESLRLYPESDGVYPAVREGRSAVLMLSRESVDELRRKIDAVRDAEPVPAPEDTGGATPTE